MFVLKTRIQGKIVATGIRYLQTLYYKGAMRIFGKTALDFS